MWFSRLMALAVVLVFQAFGLSDDARSLFVHDLESCERVLQETKKVNINIIEVMKKKDGTVTRKQGEYLKYNNLSFTDFDSTISLVTKTKMLKVDEANGLLLYQYGGEGLSARTPLSNARLMSFLETVRSIAYQKKSKNGVDYTLHFGNENYDSVVVRIDIRRSFIEQIEMYISPLSGSDVSVYTIQYQWISDKPKIRDERYHFDFYIEHDKDEIRPIGKYRGYSLQIMKP